MASLLSGDLLQSAAYYEQAIALFRELDERAAFAKQSGNPDVVWRQLSDRDAGPSGGRFCRVASAR